MGTTAQKLQKLIQTKNKLRETINNLGGDLSVNDKFSDYPKKLENLNVQSNGTTVNEVRLIEKTLPETYENKYISTIGSYSFYYDKTLKHLIFNEIGDISSFAFSNSNISEIDGKIKGTIYNRCFENCYQLGKINIENVYYISEQCFKNCFTKSRTDKDTKTIIKFSDSIYGFHYYTFTPSSSSYALYNVDFYIGKELSALIDSNFRFAELCNFYFSGAIPPVVYNSYCLSTLTNSYICCPFNSLNAYKTTTNLTANADKMRGFASENEISKFIPINTEGFKLDWYDDVECTTSAVELLPDKKYYCLINGEKVGHGLFLDYIKNCFVSITDGEKEYSLNEGVLDGTVIRISLTPENGDFDAYKLIINGIEYENNCEITVNENITIVAYYYNTQLKELYSDFENLSWEQIKQVCNNNEAKIYFELGYSKQISVANKNYTIRICDLTPNRYPYQNGENKYTNAVFEFVEVWNDYQSAGSPVLEQTWANLPNLKTTYNTIETSLPVDLRNVIENVGIIGGLFSSNSGYLAMAKINYVKLFAASEFEVYGVCSVSKCYAESRKRFELYSKDPTFIEKHRPSNTNKVTWFLRSATSGQNIATATNSTSASSTKATYGKYFGIFFAL